VQFGNKAYNQLTTRVSGLSGRIRPFRFHDLRHTAVALAIKDKRHPFEISKMLGHTSIKTTFDLYGHLL